MGMDLVSSEGLLTFEEAFEQLSGAVLIEQLEASAATAQLRVQLEKRTKVCAVLCTHSLGYYLSESCVDECVATEWLSSGCCELCECCESVTTSKRAGKHR